MQILSAMYRLLVSLTVEDPIVAVNVASGPSTVNALPVVARCRIIFSPSTPLSPVPAIVTLIPTRRVFAAEVLKMILLSDRC